MRKDIFIIGFLMMFWASPVMAQHGPGKPGMESVDGDIKVGYRWISLTDSARSGEYEYFQSSDFLSGIVEWDRLPHRFMLEYHSLNENDFFKSLDYSFSDIVVFNAISRRLFHNLDHYSFGASDPTPATSPFFIDYDPGGLYSTENTFNTFFLRLKTPDFPLHVYAEARSIHKEGIVQQRYLIGYFGADLNKISEPRNISWRTTEAKVGVNSHLGPVEVDYSHTEKRFDAAGQAVMYASYPILAGRPADVYPHNLVPDLKSSSDTVKVHTSHTGKIVAAATYSTGEKENRDSGARAEYWNAAGDLTVMPAKDVVLFFKYRHYDLTPQNPDTVTLVGTLNGTINTYSVRNSITSSKDIMTGTVRYRATDRLALKGEYSLENMKRNIGAPDWEVAPDTTRGTAKLGATYRIMKKMTMRAEYSHSDIDDPAYNFDPDTSDRAKISFIWTPTAKLSALVSYSGVREKRKDMHWEGTSGPVTGGEREAAQDQALGSFTVLVGQRSSVTTSYSYYRNQVDFTVSYHDGVGNAVLDPGFVPYDDVAHVGSVLLSHALTEAIMLTAEASRSYSRGSFRTSGAVAGTTGIGEYSDLKVIEDIYAAGVEFALGKGINTELRYQFRDYNDRINSANDGITQIALATLSVKW